MLKSANAYKFHQTNQLKSYQRFRLWVQRKAFHKSQHCLAFHLLRVPKKVGLILLNQQKLNGCQLVLQTARQTLLERVIGWLTK